MQDDCIVPPHAEVDLLTKVVYNDLTQIYPKGRMQWSTEAHTMTCGLEVTEAVLPDGDIDIPVHVLNLKEYPVIVPAGAVISPLELVEVKDDGHEVSETSSREEDPVLVEFVNCVDQSVVEEEHSQLLSESAVSGTPFLADKMT